PSDVADVAVHTQVGHDERQARRPLKQAHSWVFAEVRIDLKLACKGPAGAIQRAAVGEPAVMRAGFEIKAAPAKTVGHIGDPLVSGHQPAFERPTSSLAPAAAGAAATVAATDTTLTRCGRFGKRWPNSCCIQM